MNNDKNDNNYGNNKTKYKKHVRGTFLNKPSYKLLNKQTKNKIKKNSGKRKCCGKRKKRKRQKNSMHAKRDIVIDTAI